MTDYLKIPEVARRLDVSEPTVRRMVKGGKLPSVFVGGAYRVSEGDLEAYLESAKVVPGKDSAPPDPQQSFNGLLEDERRLRYLRGWRAFVNRLARRWEEKPPKTSAEITPLFDAMTAVVEAGVFEPSGVTDAAEAENLFALTIGFQRLNDIADRVEKDEEAEQRRATLKLIQGRISA